MERKPQGEREHVDEQLQGQHEDNEEKRKKLEAQGTKEVSADYFERVKKTGMVVVQKNDTGGFEAAGTDSFSPISPTGRHSGSAGGCSEYSSAWSKKTIWILDFQIDSLRNGDEETVGGDVYEWAN